MSRLGDAIVHSKSSGGNKAHLVIRSGPRPGAGYSPAAWHLLGANPRVTCWFNKIWRSFKGVQVAPTEQRARQQPPGLPGKQPEPSLPSMGDISKDHRNAPAMAKWVCLSWGLRFWMLNRFKQDNQRNNHHFLKTHPNRTRKSHLCALPAIPALSPTKPHASLRDLFGGLPTGACLLPWRLLERVGPRRWWSHLAQVTAEA